MDGSRGAVKARLFARWNAHVGGSRSWSNCGPNIGNPKFALPRNVKDLRTFAKMDKN